MFTLSHFRQTIAPKRTVALAASPCAAIVRIPVSNPLFIRTRGRASTSETLYIWGLSSKRKKTVNSSLPLVATGPSSSMRSSSCGMLLRSLICYYRSHHIKKTPRHRPF